MGWRERLPAAIEKAEAMVERGGNWVETKTLESRYILTPGEVALAKALWEWHCEYRYDEQVFAVSRDPKHYKEGRPSVAPALREFVEKMEGLDD